MRRWLPVSCVLLLAWQCGGPKPETIAIKKGDKTCGQAVISIAGKDDKDKAEEGSIIFDFQPAERVEGCCKSYGWIQHVKRAGEWRYDNAAFREGALGAGIGAPSDPEKSPQPAE